MLNAHQVTREFEAALCEYTGAKYAVAVNSCTMSIFLSLMWMRQPGSGVASFVPVIPCRTYVGVAQSIVHACGTIMFKDVSWSGAYRIGSTPIWDCARRFTSGMYVPGQFQCLSFHTTKILGDTQGGAILHDSDDADAWLRRARFDGRTEGVHPSEDYFRQIGWHCYLSPDVSARLLWKLNSIPQHNPDLPNDDYPDLSQFEVFRV